MNHTLDGFEASPHRDAVSVILTEVFGHDERVWSHVDPTRGIIDFDSILNGDHVFASSERVLLTAAASFWAGGAHPISLGWVANYLGDGTLGVLLRALSAARGRSLRR